MKIVVDTHILLWWMLNDRKLTKNAQDLIADPSNQVLVSSVSVWEIAVKESLGRISISLPALIESIGRNGFDPLFVSFAHCAGLNKLPPHHKDPFDRMLIAQCNAENATLLSHDETLALYGPVVMLV